MIPTDIHGTLEVICLLARRIAWATVWKVSVDTLMAAMELDEVSDPSRPGAKIGLFQFLFAGVYFATWMLMWRYGTVSFGGVDLLC